MLPDVDSLSLFIKAAELRSITLAAQASNMALSAASRRISLLEHRIGVTLLQRSSRGVELTSAGMALLPIATATIKQMHQIQAEMNEYAAGRKGILRIAANSSALSQFLPDDLASFSRQNPDVRLFVEEHWSAEIVQLVLASKADLGVIVQGVSTEGLATRIYRTDRLALILRRDHPLASRRDFQFIDVLDYDIIALESSSSMMRLLSEQALRLGRGLRQHVQARSFEVVFRLTQAGIGVGLLPYQAASDLGKSLGLVVRPLGETWAHRTMLICFKSGLGYSLPLQRLLQHLEVAH